tara:strand:- start:1522 stop:1863 length:342 start_codon:yes stop_codon:yes gene_type:complete
MDHQDYKQISIGNGGKSKVPAKKIVPKNHVDLHAIKLENETENFKITTIPKNLCKQISQARMNQKITQKEMAQKLGIQANIYTNLENGKANYDGPTKQLINKIQNLFKIKFEK